MEIRIERYNHSAFSSCPGEYLFVGGLGHLNLSRMNAVVPEFAQEYCCIARDALIQYQAQCRGITQAAFVSLALSSRLAAAKARACCTSSGSNSG